MKIINIRYIIICLLISFALSNCAESSSRSNDAPESKYAGLNILIETGGEIQLKRIEWDEYNNTSFGVILQRGDLLYPDSDTKSVVLCDNFTLWDVPAGMPSGLPSGCPSASDPIITRGKSEIGSTRGDYNSQIPFIISPRATKILTDTPTFQWNPIEGSSSYEIRLLGESIEWETSTSDTSIEYPGNPPLKSGVTYLLIIESNNGKSSAEEQVPGLGFKLLDNISTQEIEEAAEYLKGLSLSSESEKYALAHIYIRYELFYEAIELLEELVNEGSNKPSINNTLGELYLAIGLDKHAKEKFQDAYNFTKSTIDKEGRAEALVGLSVANLNLRKSDLAISNLHDALNVYKELGDDQHITEIELRLSELE